MRTEEKIHSKFQVYREESQVEEEEEEQVGEGGAAEEDEVEERKIVDAQPVVVDGADEQPRKVQKRRVRSTQRRNIIVR